MTLVCAENLAKFQYQREREKTRDLYSAYTIEIKMQNKIYSKN